MKKPITIFLLFVAVQSAYAQVANTTVEYFFNSNATLWDLADIRLGRYPDKGDEYYSIGYSFLSYDFDSGVPSINYRLDNRTGLPLDKQGVEDVCENYMESQIFLLRMNHAEIFGHRGFSNRSLSEKLDALEKSIKVIISISKINYGERVDGKQLVNFEVNDSTKSSFYCTTTGYEKPISKTWQ